jgi:ParB-like chromosome segregation protein Spo0J
MIMTSPIHDLVVEQVPIADLHPHPENARRGDVPRIMQSLDANGQFSPILINRGTRTGRPNEILAGHHLVKAATELGWQTVAVVAVDVDDESGKRMMLADNRTSDLATYDDRLLVEVLASLESLHGTGFDEGDLEALESLFTDHSWEIDEKDLQDTLDEADRDGWPVVKAKLHPTLYANFEQIEGEDDTEKLTALLTESGLGMP